MHGTYRFEPACADADSWAMSPLGASLQICKRSCFFELESVQQHQGIGGRGWLTRLTSKIGTKIHSPIKDVLRDTLVPREVKNPLERGNSGAVLLLKLVFL